MNEPIDRFYASNLNRFLNKPHDHLVVDPNNSELVERHVASLIDETNGALSADDEPILGRALFDAAKNTKKARVARSTSRLFRYQPPQIKLTQQLRGDIGESYDLVLQHRIDSGRRQAAKIGSISDYRMFREAYVGSIFPFAGELYRVHSHQEGEIVLHELQPKLRHMTTSPSFYDSYNISEVFSSQIFGSTANIHYGLLNIHTHFRGYKLIDTQTGGEGIMSGNPSWYTHSNRHAFWIEVQSSHAVDAQGLVGLENLLRVGAMFVIPTDRFDASTLSIRGDMIICYYENYTGGIGVAKQLLNVWRLALNEGIRIADNCSCRRGCPNCIEPPKAYRNTDIDKIDKNLGINLARKILVASRTQ